MNVKHAKILLEKINRLFTSMTMDDHISEIEKELMRNYVKSLYEEFLPENGVKAKPIVEAPKVVKSEPKVVRETPKAAEPAPRVAEKPPVVETPAPPPPKVEVAPEPPAPPKPAPQPVAVEKPKVAVEEKVTPPPPVVKKAAPAPAPTPKPAKAKISEEMEELFEFKQAKDLGEKLSDSPLKDLRKAMGINERILTTNELFDGNGDALKDALSTLNNLNNFEEAKEYLANIGDIYDWTSKKKKKKAKVFVKLIRRRFL